MPDLKFNVELPAIAKVQNHFHIRELICRACGDHFDRIREFLRLSGELGPGTTVKEHPRLLVSQESLHK